MLDYQGSAIYDPNGFAKLRPFGPFIDPRTFEMQPTTVRSLIIAIVVFGVTMMFAGLAVVIGVQQTKASRNPWKSTYIWMIWIELGACIIIAIESMLYLTYVIRPSFYFYMSILFLWALQINLLLQIIINRIRIILLDRERGRILVISVAVLIVTLNISVFCIWMPARLQISRYYVHINNIWDRTEKGIYLLVDGALNFYFIRVVRNNLIVNGLQKYNRLVRFNERMIIVSLLMDVMIIGAMSIPNGFVYTLFHPLAFLVKLNIEMTMANLIRKIALEDSNLQTAFMATYASESSSSSSMQLSSPKSQTSLRRLIFPLFGPNHHSTWWGRSLSQEDGIKKTQEFSVMSRRISQMSAHVFRVSKYQTEQKKDVFAMEDVGLASVHVAEERRESGTTSVDAASNGAASDGAASYAPGDEVELMSPPATLQRH